MVIGLVSISTVKGQKGITKVEVNKEIDPSAFDMPKQ